LFFITRRATISQTGKIMTTVDIRSDLKAKFDNLVNATNRSETELINEALELYLLRNQNFVQRIEQRLREADEGQFVSDDEVTSFFSNVGTPH